MVPVTYSLAGTRAALLAGAGWRELWPSIAALLLFAAILIPLSFLLFARAPRRTKVTLRFTHI
jgi:ABC-type multidrug transport system permease subunit